MKIEELEESVKFSERIGLPFCTAVTDTTMVRKFLELWKAAKDSNTFDDPNWIFYENLKRAIEDLENED